MSTTERRRRRKFTPLDAAQRALEVSRMAQWRFSVESQLFICDPLARSVLGLKEGKRAIAWPDLFAAVHREDRAPMEEGFRECVDGDASELHVRFRMQVGYDWKWISLHGGILLKGGPTRRYVVGTLKDITNDRLSEEMLTAYAAEVELARRRDEGRAKELAEKSMEIEKALQAAEAATEAKSAFLAGMSHEIRTPMNGIHGMAALLLESELSGDQRDFAETIRSSADSLLAILNDILDLSKVESGRIALEAITFRLSDVVDDVFDLMATSVQSKNLDLAALVSDDAPFEVCGDPVRLRQILLNLVGNAVKFTEAGHVTVRIRAAGAGRVRFEVSDSGIGISVRAQEHLFQAFAQADLSTTRRFGGTGLGLTISKRLVEAMHGEIGVQSTPGEGSTFWFEVELGTSATEAAETRFTGRTILIAARNTLALESLLGALSRWGARVETCESPHEFLLRRDDPLIDCMIVDPNLFSIDELRGDEAILADRALRQAWIKMGHSSDRCINLPLRIRQLATVLAMGGRTEPPPPPPLNLQEGAGLRILVIEDNAVNQKVAERLLGIRGYTVEIAANGALGVEAVLGGEYDAVLMDCRMPVMDGYEATRRIRAAEAPGRHLPIIALTASVLAENHAKCLEAGMDDILTKPFRAEQLYEIVHKWIPQPALK